MKIILDYLKETEERWQIELKTTGYREDEDDAQSEEDDTISTDTDECDDSSDDHFIGSSDFRLRLFDVSDEVVLE